MKNEHSYKTNKGTNKTNSNEDEPLKKVHTAPNSVLQIGDDEEATRQFSKRELSSNWNKYEEDRHIEDNEQLSAADFENLLIAPASVGNHFVFSTEKNWGEQSADIQSSQYFQLNLAELAKNMNCIPFYLRQGYSVDLFNENEQQDMVEKAQAMRKLIQSQQNDRNLPFNVSNHGKSDKSEENVITKKASSVVPILNENKIINSMPINKIDDEELEELLEIDLKPPTILNIQSLQLEETIEIKPIPVVDDSKKIAKTNDLQQWLDDIFDD